MPSSSDARSTPSLSSAQSHELLQCRIATCVYMLCAAAKAILCTIVVQPLCVTECKASPAHCCARHFMAKWYKAGP